MNTCAICQREIKDDEGLYGPTGNHYSCTMNKKAESVDNVINYLKEHASKGELLTIIRGAMLEKSWKELIDTWAVKKGIK